MKKHRLQKKFLEEITRTPIVQHACEKVGISRNTYYRWVNEDIDFSLAAEECLRFGIDFVNDHAESNILSGIKKGEMRATTYWLSHRHKEYRKPFIIKRESDLLEDNYKLEMAQAHKDVDVWVDGWMKGEEERKLRIATELFEEWKKEELKKKSGKKLNTTSDT
jgi:hypothetical protein